MVIKTSRIVLFFWFGYIAFFTLLDFMHAVQTYSRVFLPSRTIFKLWRFGLKSLFVALFEWLIVFPDVEPFPQITHL
jgi:hypothetical protein